MEKLRRQLEPAWRRRTITRITQPPNTTSPGAKHLVPNATAMRGLKIDHLDRHGKFLWIQGEEKRALKIHLSSTGWFMPGEGAHTKPDEIYDNFLHRIQETNIRLRVHLDDGQTWNYHDPRTWGKIIHLEGVEKPSDDAQIAALGPDWVKDTHAAEKAIVHARTKRAAKDVLTDQSLAAGVGNYLAVEAMAREGLYPRQPWDTLDLLRRHKIANAIRQTIEESFEHHDHSHWRVFGKAGETCPTCNAGIVMYVKDGASSKRGSYYCPRCQPPWRPD